MRLYKYLPILGCVLLYLFQIRTISAQTATEKRLSFSKDSTRIMVLLDSLRTLFYSGMEAAYVYLDEVEQLMNSFDSEKLKARTEGILGAYLSTALEIRLKDLLCST